jgi:hypothetical protein
MKSSHRKVPSLRLQSDCLFHVNVLGQSPFSHIGAKMTKQVIDPIHQQLKHMKMQTSLNFYFTVL